MLEITEAFKLAFDDGKDQKEVLFFFILLRRKGPTWFKIYTENPLYPLPYTIADLNIDMIGRINPKRNSNNPNYIYLIGSDKISKELHNTPEEINEKYTQLELDYTYNKEDDPNRFYYRSDHYNFAKITSPLFFILVVLMKIIIK